MRRYLVVLDMDLLAADEKFDLEPVNYLVAQEEREPCEAVVLSLANTATSGCPPWSFFSARGRGSFPSRPSRAITSGRRPNTG